MAQLEKYRRSSGGRLRAARAGGSGGDRHSGSGARDNAFGNNDTLVKGTMQTMTRLKVQFAAGLGLAALLAGCSQSPVPSDGGDKLTAQEIAEKSRDAYAALSSYSDSGTVVSEMAGQNNTLRFNIRLQRPNLYRVDWAQGTTPNLPASLGQSGAVWSDGSGDYLLTTTAGQEKDAKPQTMPDMKKTFALATGPSWSAASTIPGVFFNQDLGDLFGAPAASGRYPLQKEKDGKVGDVDCYVVSGVIDLSKEPENGKPGTATTTLWIGKRDFLIHQSRTKYVEKVDASAPPSDQAIDEAIKKSLEMQKKPVTPDAIAAGRPQMTAIMKQVQSTLKSGFESGVVFTQTHERIVVNKKLSPADFAR
jgi:hypothetical protein